MILDCRDSWSHNDIDDQGQLRSHINFNRLERCAERRARSAMVVRRRDLFHAVLTLNAGRSIAASGGEVQSSAVKPGGTEMKFAVAAAAFLWPAASGRLARRLHDTSDAVQCLALSLNLSSSQDPNGPAAGQRSAPCTGGAGRWADSQAGPGKADAGGRFRPDAGRGQGGGVALRRRAQGAGRCAHPTGQTAATAEFELAVPLVVHPVIAAEDIPERCSLLSWYSSTSRWLCQPRETPSA